MAKPPESYDPSETPEDDKEPPGEAPETSESDTDTDTARDEVEPGEVEPGEVETDEVTADEVTADEVTAEETAETAPDPEHEDPVAAGAAGTDDTDTTGDEDAPRDSGAELAGALGSAALVSSAQEERDIGADDETTYASEDPNAAHHHDEHYDEHEEHAQRSFASKVLTWLILLLVGGGVALWAAPRIAPHLPDGLGPVKAWMMPGEFESRERVAALEAQVDERLAGLDTGPDEKAVRAIVAGELANLPAQDMSEVTALSEQIAALDPEGLRERIVQIESRLDGLVAHVESMTALTPGEGVSAEQAAEISNFATAVEGLKGEMSSLSERQGALSQRVEELDAALAGRLQEAEAEVEQVREDAERTQSQTTIRAALSSIEAALASGDPYEKPLAELQGATEMAIPEGVTAAAGTGVSTLGQLRTGFSDAAHDAIRAAIRSEGEGNVGNRLVSFLEAQVASRSLTPQEGDDADAVLSRAEDALRRDNLAAAMSELEALPAPARDAMDGWMSRASARLAAMSGFEELRSTLTAQN